jgi:hypothetical protein
MKYPANAQNCPPSQSTMLMTQMNAADPERKIWRSQDGGYSWTLFSKIDSGTARHK